MLLLSCKQNLDCANFKWMNENTVNAGRGCPVTAGPRRAQTADVNAHCQTKPDANTHLVEQGRTRPCDGNKRDSERNHIIRASAVNTSFLGYGGCYHIR